MVFLVSDEVKPKNGGPCMIVTGYSSGMTDTALSGRLFVKMSFSLVIKGKNAIRLNHTTPGLAGRFYWQKTYHIGW